MRKKLTGMLAVMIAVVLMTTSLFIYAPVYYATGTELLKLSDAVKDEIVNRIKLIEKADDDYLYCDISDFNLSEDNKDELREYINELTAKDCDLYWLDWCVVYSSENKLIRLGLSLKEQYYYADSESIDKKSAKQDYEILQKRLGNGELKTILKERLLTEGLENKTINLWDLNLYAKDDKLVCDYVEVLISTEAALYWIKGVEFDDDYYSIMNGTDEERNRYHLREFKIVVKDKYDDSSFENNVNQKEAQKDFEEFQERLGKIGWKQLLKERIHDSVKENAQTQNEYNLNIRDLCIEMDKIEFEEYIVRLGETDPYVFMVGEKVDAYSDCEGKYINSVTLSKRGDYGKDDESGVDYDKIFRKFYHYKYRISSLTAQMEDTMSDVEKTFAIQQWVTRELDYNLFYSHNICGVLDEGYSACQYYAELTNHLLKIYGIPVYTMISNPMDHAWNMVKLDGKYYHMDTTWDDSGYRTDYEGESGTTYFLRSDERFYNIIPMHYDWYCLELPETPVSDSENAYDGYIFRNGSAKDKATRFSYYKGYWYYFGSNYIYRSKIDGTDKKIMAHYGDSKNTIVNMFVYKKQIYVVLKDGVYATYMQEFVSGNTEMELVYDVENDPDIPYINQFTIKQDTLRVGNNGVVKVIPLENASSLKMDETAMELAEGDKVKAEVNYISENGSDVVWGTDNEDVINVSADGIITAKSEGIATVYAGVDDCMDKMQVTVKKAVQPAPEYNSLSEIDNGLVYVQDAFADIQIVSGISDNTTVLDLKRSYLDADIAIKDQNGTDLEDDKIAGTGNIICLLRNDDVIDQAVICIKGDVDGNGKIDVLDMEAIQKHILGIDELNGVYKIAAKLNDAVEKISVLDMEAVQKFILGIREFL